MIIQQQKNDFITTFAPQFENYRVAMQLYSGVTQQVAWLPHQQKVVGSIPIPATNKELFEILHSFNLKP